MIDGIGENSRQGSKLVHFVIAAEVVCCCDFSGLAFSEPSSFAGNSARATDWSEQQQCIKVDKMIDSPFIH